MSEDACAVSMALAIVKMRPYSYVVEKFSFHVQFRPSSSPSSSSSLSFSCGLFPVSVSVPIPVSGWFQST